MAATSILSFYIKKCVSTGKERCFYITIIVCNVIFKYIPHTFRYDMRNAKLFKIILFPVLTSIDVAAALNTSSDK